MSELNGEEQSSGAPNTNLVQPPTPTVVETAATSPGFSPISAVTDSNPALTTPVKPGLPSQQMMTTPFCNPLSSSSPTYQGHSAFFQQPPQFYQAPPPLLTGPASLDTIAQQVFTLSQCVMSLTNKVHDNNKLFEENFRLKDIVIDLEFKLREANARVKSVEILRESMTSQFAELNETILKIGGGSFVGPAGSDMESNDEGFNNQTSEILDYTDTLATVAEIPDPNHLRPEPGTLNLQNREMTQIPDDVYKLNDPELLKSLTATSGDDLKWWESEPINKLYLCSNKISLITPDIQQLSSLTLLDLRDNCLESLPKEMAALEHLTRLELSHNKISSLPTGLGPKLTHLSLNNNLFNELPGNISEMSCLIALDIRENTLKALPALPVTLETLAVDENKLSSLVCENMAHMISISASGNVLTHVRIGNMPNLKNLSVRVNKLEFIEPIVKCPSLIELYLGKNFLSLISFVNTLTSLVVLDCSDNKIQMIPDEVTKMTNLKRLDLSNNDLNNLPPQLGNMEQLESLSVDGNPLRTIRREIISKGTNAVKEYLRMKLAPPEDTGPVIPDIVVDEKMMKSKNMELDKKTVADIDSSLWDQALACGITRLSMKSSGHGSIPEPVFTLRITLQELDLSCNSLHMLPPEIGKLVKLRKLSLLKNNIRELPNEISELKALEDLNMSQNKLSAIPECLFGLSALSSLILSNNQINKLEPAKLMGMTSLACLDLENNSIGRLPPEICLLPSIRNLLVLGNTFKMPRADVLSKGSSEVLAWLKNKVPR